jgi:dimethylglycine catabolism A
MLLSQPGQIGSLKLKNRVLMAPMGTNYSTTDGFSTERDCKYYAERAKGGVAMIMTEAMIVTEAARSHHNSLCCFHDRFIPGLSKLVQSIKEHDCHVFGQLNHRGALLRRMVLNMEPVGPSDWVNPNTGDAVRALTIPEIHDIQSLFVQAAKRLWIAGYDGVELHAGNGYLFQQFFTRRINKRSDQYGGSIQNRMRLLLETIDRVRTELPDLTLAVRLSASEYTPDGYSQEEIIELAQAVERAGADALDLSGGSNESPQLSKYCIQPPSFAHGCLAPIAKPLKQAVKIPVFVAGRIVTPEDAENVLRSGSADFVSIGRGLYADPHWALKAFGEVKAPIRECIACNVCFERLTIEKDVSCVQNPMVGTEFEALPYAEPQLFAPGSSPRKRVLILGAGVAGIEAARVAAGRGHTVEVWEKASQPGGQIHLAVAGPDKSEVWPVWNYRWQTLQTLKVPVRTNVRATAESIQAFKPDFIVLATGAQPQAAPLDTLQVAPSIAKYHAWDVFENPDLVGSNSHVTIIGAGMVGAELADLLRLRGCHIRLLEMQGHAANGMARNNKYELLERLADSGVDLVTHCQITSIQGRTVMAIVKDMPTQFDVGDYLIFANGPKSNLDILQAVQSTGVSYECIGDCSKPGDFLTAIRDGWMVALRLDQTH